MEISKKALIITMIVDLVLFAVGIVCLFVTKFNPIAIGMFVGLTVLILVSSILVWKYGKEHKKQ